MNQLFFLAQAESGLSSTVWTYIFVTITFMVYLYIGWSSRVKESSEFYVAGHGVPAIANGAATAADWMSAASFLGMAGLISTMGSDGSIFLLGWTGGYVLLALLLAPYLRKFGQYTVPDFVAKRYYSETARVVAALCAVFVSLTYVAGQMQGVGIVFARFLEVSKTTGVIIGMVIVGFFAVLGGMKGITWTQVVQYGVLIVAFLIPTIWFTGMMTDTSIPQVGFITGDVHTAVNLIHKDLGFDEYTKPFASRSKMNVLLMMFALMAGTAGLPHVIVRFYTVSSVRAARYSAGWALLFIALLYTAAPVLSLFARSNILETLHKAEIVGYETLDGNRYDKLDQLKADAPTAYEDKDFIYKLEAIVVDEKTKKEVHVPVDWINSWQANKLIVFDDTDGDGVIQMNKVPKTKERPSGYQDVPYFHNDILVIAAPEAGGMPNWVIAIVATGGLAAALSTAAGLLLVISSSMAHDLYIHFFEPDAPEHRRILVGRIMIIFGIIIAGYFGIVEIGFIAEVVAIAFGLAAASFFPVIFLGIFDKRCNREGAVSGMIVGILFTAGYILACETHDILPFMFKEPLMEPWLKGLGALEGYEFFKGGISPQGIGTIGCLLNFIVAIVVSRLTPAPPEEIQQLVEDVRIPRGSHDPEAHFDETDAGADNP
ncbi:MAG: cation acetate symporter [Blastopirellula sp.]|nr:MAG: cation acetate symporter [Blastopirellula sp.]